MPFDHLALERHRDLAVLRLASGKLNALSIPLVAEVHRALDGLEADPRPSALILTGGESRFFSYGLDVPGLLGVDRPTMTRFLGEVNRMLARFFEFPRPVVAAVNGHATAGGLLLALTADVRVGAPGEYVLGIPEVKLGLAAPAGSLRMLARRLGPERTARLALGGTTLTPLEALAEGILSELAAGPDLQARAREVAAGLAEAPPEAVAINKRYLSTGVYDLAPEIQDLENAAWIDRWFSPDAQERLRKLAERK